MSRVRLTTGAPTTRIAGKNWGGIRIRSRELGVEDSSFGTTQGWSRNAKCPDCNGKMVVRTNRVAKTTFLGCKSYPGCKGTRPIPAIQKAQHQHGSPAPP